MPMTPKKKAPAKRKGPSLRKPRTGKDSVESRFPRKGPPLKRRAPNRSAK